MIRVLSVTIAFNLIISVLSLLCLALPTASAGGPISVYVVNYPLKYFAERIGSPHVKVTLQVPPHFSTWKACLLAIEMHRHRLIFTQACLLFNHGCTVVTVSSQQVKHDCRGQLCRIAQGPPRQRSQAAAPEGSWPVVL